jgi:hypothetical protein
MSFARHGHTAHYACCAHCPGKPCLHHGHGFGRHALIALGSHHRVPHRCPVWLGLASDHAIDAFVRSLSEPEVHEALREVRRANHHANLHHVTNLNARTQLNAALHASRHSHLLLGSGPVAGSAWGKSAGRIGESHKGKKDKDGKDSKQEEEEETKEKGRLVGIELECQHAEEEKKPEGEGGGASEEHEAAEGSPEKGSKGKPERKSRWAGAGEVLGVVPRATGTDTVKLKAKIERDPDWINWTGKGWKGFTHQGEEFSYHVPGYALNSIIDLLPENGIWGARIQPKIIEVEAKDQDGRSAKAKIAVYPDHTNTIKGRIGKHRKKEDYEDAQETLLGRLVSLAEEVEKGLKKIPLLPVEVEPKFPDGNWHVTMGFTEDPESNGVFMKVDLGAAFDPLIGMAIKYPVPVLKLQEVIPQKLRKYIGEIEAYFELEGKFFVNLSIGRLAYRELNVKGELGGILGVSLNFSVKIGQDKVLKVVAKAGTEIKPEGLFQGGKMEGGDELKVYWQALIEFGGLTGMIYWDVWDGKWTHENSWHFLDSREICKTDKHLLFK